MSLQNILELSTTSRLLNRTVANSHWRIMSGWHPVPQGDLSTITLSLVLSEKVINCKKLCRCYLLIPGCENVSTRQPIYPFNLHGVRHLFLCMSGPNQHFS